MLNSEEIKPIALAVTLAKRLNDTTHGHQTLPQLQTPSGFQVPMRICPLHLVPSFIFMVMAVFFFMQQSHTCVLIFWIDTFCIRRHKINSEEFYISGEKLVHP